MGKTRDKRPRAPLKFGAMPAWASGRRIRHRSGGTNWRNWAFILLLIGGLAIYALLPEPPFPLGGTPLTGPVERVADGDTLEIAGQRIRLLGLDAPEWNQTCHTADGAEWPCGRDAAQKLRELAAGRALNCSAEGHDRYGRLLATCRDGRVDVAEVMVGEGLAVATDAYAGAQAAARRARKGIWQGDFDTPAAWRQREAMGEDASGGNPSRFERFMAWLMGLFAS